VGKQWGKLFLFVFLRFCAYDNVDKDVYADNDDTCKREIYLPFLSDELTTPDTPNCNKVVIGKSKKQKGKSKKSNRN